MNSDNRSVLDVFFDNGAVIRGHFVLSSGFHTDHFFQKTLVYENALDASFLNKKLSRVILSYGLDFDYVVVAAVGGIVIGYDVARILGKRFVFFERGSSRKLFLKRTFSIGPKSSCIIVDDIFTTGSTLRELYDICVGSGIHVLRAFTILDRSPSMRSSELLFDHISLERCDKYPLYSCDDIPDDLKKIPEVSFSSR